MYVQEKIVCVGFGTIQFQASNGGGGLAMYPTHKGVVVGLLYLQTVDNKLFEYPIVLSIILSYGYQN